ncbi:MAG: putative Ig domain-containing protein [Acidobacteria bacterium]|nr:putative Ig domain-containing protein [Acidobacteriota bacterium]
MSTPRRLIATLLFIVCGFTSSLAQEPEFELTSGRVGEVYQQSIDKILAQKYRLKLETGVQGAAFEWAAVENLPAGLRLNSDGMITGVPQSHQAQPYRFRVKITDRSIRDAEALELTFSIQMLPPRIKLVSSNAPRLVPTYSAPEQSSPPAGSTSVASAEGNGNGNGNGNVGAASENGAAQPAARASRFSVTPTVQPQTAENEATPTQTPEELSPLESLKVQQYIYIAEETTSGNRYPLTIPAKVAADLIDDLRQKAVSKAGNNDAVVKSTEEILKPLEGVNFRLRSDHESTIIIQRIEPPSAACLYVPGQATSKGLLKYIVSGELVKENGSTPLSLIGTPVASVRIQSGATTDPDSIQVQLSTESPLATVNLKQSNAGAKDQVKLVIEAVCESPTQSAEMRVMGRRSYDIELTDLGWEQGVSPSLFLLNRQRVRRVDEQAINTTLPANTTPPVGGTLANPINPVNYSPFPGVNYTFTYKGESRNKDKAKTGSKILSFLKPGFGFNATFMDFNDQSINLQNFNVQIIQDQIFNKDSDVQMGLGVVATFFGNNLQLTYGGNLAVDRKKAYLGFGLDLLKLFDFLR